MSSGRDQWDTPSHITAEITLPEPLPAPRLHVLHIIDGAHAGRLAVLEPGESIVGRSETCQLPLADAGISRTHAVFVTSPIGVHLSDLGSRNGSFVNGRQITAEVLLRSGDTVSLGGVHMRYALELEDQVKRLRDLYEAAVRDHLTSLHNRRFFEERLPAEVAYAARHAAPLSILMFDVDHFKRVNDEHGHAAGDAALKVVAAVLARGVRTEDLVARYGGEEFVVMARGAGLEGALALAERLRQRVEASKVEIDGKVLHVTVSAGTAALSAKIVNQRQLMRAADFALYEAKNQGRNRVAGSTGESGIERTGELEAVKLDED